MGVFFYIMGVIIFIQIALLEDGLIGMLLLDL